MIINSFRKLLINLFNRFISFLLYNKRNISKFVILLLLILFISTSLYAIKPSSLKKKDRDDDLPGSHPPVIITNDIRS